MLEVLGCRLKPFHPVLFHIETSHLICSATQLTSFCMKHKTAPILGEEKKLP